MKFACIVIPYFGALKKSIVLFMESCRRNPEIDWLFFTDCEVPIADLPENVVWKTCQLSDVEKLARKKLDRTVELKRPYKLCDLKPLYGVIFEDYLKDYLWWGFGDVDVIYGRIYPYMDKIKFDLYDKISFTGHLTVIRNNDRCKWAFDEPIENSIEVNHILLDGDHNFGFDELVYNKKFIARGLKIYGGIWAADIDCLYKRMRCVDEATLKQQRIQFTETPVNYFYQIFAIIGGRAYRYYIYKGQVNIDEFAYIHFRREVPIFFSDMKADSFIITRKGFYEVDKKLLGDRGYLKKISAKYNKADLISENFRCLYYSRLINSKFISRIVNHLIKIKKEYLKKRR